MITTYSRSGRRTDYTAEEELSELHAVGEAERQLLLTELVCAGKRVDLLLNEVRRIYVALRGDIIDVDTAMEWLGEAQGLEFLMLEGEPGDAAGKDEKK
jgi:hypothetical protein